MKNGNLPDMFQIDGIVPIIPTPFEEDESIHFEELAALVRFAGAAGASAVCLPAYASVFYKWTEGERLEVVVHAVNAANGGVPVIAQVNAPCLRAAREWGAAAVAAGATAICTAAPRAVPLPEYALVDYYDAFLDAVDAPVILQDYNPGGASLSVASLARLHRDHANFRYVKLEDAMLAPKVAAIREATGDGLGVLEGWGGMYTLELAQAGIAGVVPGLALTDILGCVLHLARSGDLTSAQPLFEGILPQIVYSLQSIEFFHHAEKRLLKARGVIQSTTVRMPRLKLSSHEESYIDQLNDRILRLLEAHEFPLSPEGLRHA
jgi:2-keto-3-deoxy-L-arabinonate dehydratase